MADPKAMIPVVDPETGKTGYIDPKFAPDAERTGLRSATDRELRGAQVQANAAATAADLDAEYGGAASGAGAFAAGAARGVSLGMSDVALSELGGDSMRRRLLDYQEARPGLSLAGEVTGIAAPMLLGDGAGLANLPGLVGKLGAGAELAVAGGLGRGLLARGAGVAARGAVEGAIYAEGKAAGDAALHNEDLTVEKSLAAVGHGALFGAGANVLLAGAGAGLSRLVGREASAEAGAFARSAEGSPYRAAGREVEGAVAAEAKAGGIGDTIQKQADIKTIKALSGSAGDFRAMERNVAGGYRKVAQDIREDIETATGKSIGRHNKESLHEYAAARVEELGDKLGGMLKKLDDSGSAIAPDVKAFSSKVHEELVAPHLVPHASGASVILPGQEAGVNAAQKWLAKVEAAFGESPPTFTQWQKMRRGLDKDINFARVNQTPEMESLKQVRAIMEKELESSGEAAARNVGASFAGEYQATKSLYQSVRTAEELSLRGVSREMVNNGLGLRATMGAVAGIATGNPIMGVAAGVGGMLVKDRGDMLAADLLHRVANLVGIQRLVSRTDAVMSKEVSGLLGTKALVTGALAEAPRRSVAAPLGVALSGNLHGDFDKVQKETTRLSSNPVHLTEKVAAALGPEASKSPALAAAFTRTLAGDVAFLAAKLPQRRTDAFTLQPHLQPETRASDSEKHEFIESAKALDDPTIMLRQARAGALTPVTVAAIKERRPELYAQMRTDIAQSLMTSKSELPYGRRIQLGILLDLPTDQTLAPDFVSAIQATYSPSENGDVEPPPTQLSQLDVAGSSMTATQAASGGLDR